MSKTSQQRIKINKNEFRDRSTEENKNCTDLNVQLQTIGSVLLLLDSQEEKVLISVLRNLVEQTRRVETTLALLKEANLLQLLLQKQFFRTNSNVFVKRLSLYLASFIIENSNCLVELESSKLKEILSLSTEYQLQEDDDFCCEYLSVILNKCLDDPQCSDMVLKDIKFIQKYFSVVATTSNPDILLNSLQLLLKLLLVQKAEDTRNFVTLPTFPLNRLLCELNCEYFDIRKAALKVLHFLLLDSNTNNIFDQDEGSSFLLKQLTNRFCETSLNEESVLLAEVLAASMGHEKMISLFVQLNLFDKYLERLNNKSLESETICKSLVVFTECAKCLKLLNRLVSANITEMLLESLLTGDGNPEFHILLGLNRLMKSCVAAKTIIDYYNQGLLDKLLKILTLETADARTREQSAKLLENLLAHSFHQTVRMIFDMNFILVLAGVFAPNTDHHSTDLFLSLLRIIEMISENADFKSEICKHHLLIRNMGLLLKNSFSNGMLVTHLFRCLCCLVDEEEIHNHLLQAFLCSSIKRALQSGSTLLKTAVTNFIMQTTRFPKFMATYNESGILEVLLLRQTHAYCVPTWQPAIESILAKNLTMKFCIRNSLGFTDVTVGQDFMVSKRKFNDFRLFQCILKEEVSPLQPIIVVNFNRPKTPESLIVRVPPGCSQNNDLIPPSSEAEWCYSRLPGDEFLPQYLQQVNSILEGQNLISNAVKIKNNNIDFDNLAKRAKVIAQVVEQALAKDLKLYDLNTSEECSALAVNSHMKEICIELHCSFIPLGRIRSGCKFERAILFKALADQVGLPCTLQRSVDGQVLFNEMPFPLTADDEDLCDRKTLAFIPWRLLRPTHVVDLMYNVGELYPLQSRQALQYLGLF